MSRPKLPGGTYLFSVRLRDAQSDLLLREVGHLRAATRATKMCHPFRIDAAVVLPACLHMIWTLPAGDANYAMRWAMLKATFSKGLPAAPGRSAGEIKRGSKGIWAPRFDERLIRTPADFALCLDFVHSAPVAAGLAVEAEDWLHSSIHRQRDALFVPPTLTFETARPDQELLHGLILPTVQQKAPKARPVRRA